MAWINDYRQVGKPFEHRHGGNIQRVARIVFKGADTALAEDHVFIPACHNIFRAHERFLNRIGEASL